MKNPSETPVLLLIFNRPDKVKTLIDTLGLVRPKNVYVFADGPRETVDTDPTKCMEAREYALNIPWECTIRTKFLEENKGCDIAVPEGIDWFFQNVDAGIILEDDCIPHPDFFKFTTNLLDRFKDSNEIMLISGDNFQDGKIREGGNYYFSRYANIWGWATWRRAWNTYDPTMSHLPTFLAKDKIKSSFDTKSQQKYWLKYFKSLYSKNRINWDAKWQFAISNSKGVAVVPNNNLVQNIGFDADATHTDKSNEKKMSISSQSIEDLIHPATRTINTEADLYLFKKIYEFNFFRKIKYAAKLIKEKINTIG